MHLCSKSYKHCRDYHIFFLWKCVIAQCTDGQITTQTHTIRNPANTKHLYNICTMLEQRRRRWSDVAQMLYKCFVFAWNDSNHSEDSGDDFDVQCTAKKDLIYQKLVNLHIYSSTHCYLTLTAC